MANQPHICTCNCSKRFMAPHQSAGVTRREFLYGVGAISALSLTGKAAQASRPAVTTSAAGNPLPRASIKVQPVLTYEVPQRRQATSWRNWGGIQTEQDALQEKERIGRELERISSLAGGPMEIRPTVLVRNTEQAAQLAGMDHDVLLLYAARPRGQQAASIFRTAAAPIFPCSPSCAPREAKRAPTRLAASRESMP